jgi:hypothetical protein
MSSENPAQFHVYCPRCFNYISKENPEIHIYNCQFCKESVNMKGKKDSNFFATRLEIISDVVSENTDVASEILRAGAFGCTGW